jgi:hypothetical protein
VDPIEDGNAATDTTAAIQARAQELISRALRDFDSATRLEFVLSLLRHEPSGAVFWRVISEIWNCCDNTWDHRNKLYFMMVLHSRTRRRNLPDEMQPMATLPRLVDVWRGCSRDRVRGLAWTLDKSVAEGFARGHRGIRVPDPVLVSAIIPKTAIFFMGHDRLELEVVLDPYKLRSIAFTALACPCVQPVAIRMT